MSDLKEDLKTFLKVKKPKEDETILFLEIPENRKKIIYQENSKNLKIVKSDYSMNKIFLENDEYSYIYEDITRNTINDSINGINSTFFSYGNSNSEKHELLFSSENSIYNINERGIFPRIIQNILIKENINISISIMFNYGNKIYDICHISNHYNLIFDNIIKEGIEIGQNSNVIEKMNKIKISSFDDFIVLMKQYIEFFNFLQKYDYEKINENGVIIESKFPFFFSFSNFIYVIYIYKDNNLISNLTFVELSCNDDLITKYNISKSPNDKKSYNTKHFIENNYMIECIKKSIYLLKKPILLKIPCENYIELCLDCKLMIILKNLSFSKTNSRFTFIGCIYPNKAYQKSIKDTLDTLYQIQRLFISKNSLEENKELIDKDKYIFLLEERVKDYNKIIKNQNELIEKKQNKNNIIQENYKEQIKVLKECFDFEGDINILLSGNENTKEYKIAKKMRESVNDLKKDELIIEKLKERIKFLENEIEKNENLKDVKLQDQNMINFFNEIREKNTLEENKLRMHLDHDIKLNQLESENKKLNVIINEYKKENENKFKYINNIPNILKENCDIQKKINEIKNNIQSEYDQKLKKEIFEISNNNKKEREKIEFKYEKLLQLKEEENKKLKNELEKINNENKINYNNLITESVLLYELLNNIFQKFKKEFSQMNFTSVKKFNNLILSKNNFQELLENTEKSINMFSFPITLKEVNSKYNNLLNKGDFKKLKIEPISKILNNCYYSSNNNIMENINQIKEKNKILEEENEELKQKLENIEINNIDLEKIIFEKMNLSDDKRLMNDREKMRKKLEESINRNIQNEIIIKSQKRLINKLNNEKLLIKMSSEKNYKNYFLKHLKVNKKNIQLKNQSVSPNLSLAKNGNSTLFSSNTSKMLHRPLTGLNRSKSSSMIFNK